jgi:hypothetical protein
VPETVIMTEFSAFSIMSGTVRRVEGNAVKTLLIIRIICHGQQICVI